MTKLIKIMCIAVTSILMVSCSDTLPLKSNTASTERVLSCEPEALQSFVGKKFTPELSQQILSQSHVKTIRVLKPRQPVLMNYDAQRVNVHLDKNGVIGMVTCG